MRELDITADRLIEALTGLPAADNVCILDSGGVGHLGSHLMIAGADPVDVIEVSDCGPETVLETLDSRLLELAGIFTLSYGFGEKLNNISAGRRTVKSGEPDLFLALYDCLIVHDYESGRTFLTGDTKQFDTVEEKLKNAPPPGSEVQANAAAAHSNFSRQQYCDAVDAIKNRIRNGDTYQTNLTQQIRFPLADAASAGSIFRRLRKDHPGPFGSFLTRRGSCVVSASPERFLKVTGRTVTASPIKGTRPRGDNAESDARSRAALLASQKDRAENAMIVDLTRNDLGRVCEFGSVKVERLCEIEEHPTLFHLVSTVSGLLRKDVRISDIVRATFPCGSITGAPKINTMRIIAELEKADRGLSMGSVGLYVPDGFPGLRPSFELNVAIRTMVIRDREAVLNVGGGIVIDSDPQAEYEESLLKAKALLAAAGAELIGN